LTAAAIFYGGIVSDDILIGGWVQMARKQRAEQWAEHRRQREEEERRQRVMVITEFAAGDPDATMHALADEILKYRRALRLLADAVGWASTGVPFALFPPALSGDRSVRGTPSMVPTSCRQRRRVRASRFPRPSGRLRRAWALDAGDRVMCR